MGLRCSSLTTLGQNLLGIKFSTREIVSSLASMSHVSDLIWSTQGKSQSFRCLLWFWKSSYSGGLHMKIWLTALITIIWSIRTERNKRCFKDKVNASVIKRAHLCFNHEARHIDGCRASLP